jgi:hypothetical protein
MDKLLRAASVAAQTIAIYGRIREGSRRALIRVVSSLIGLVFVIFALLWFDLALWFYCAPRIGPAFAALVAGGGMLLVAIAIVVIPRLRTRSPPPVRAAPTDGLAAAIHELNGLFRQNKGMILVAAALLGALLGARPPKRP